MWNLKGDPRKKYKNSLKSNPLQLYESFWTCVEENKMHLTLKCQTKLIQKYTSAIQWSLILIIII